MATSGTYAYRPDVDEFIVEAYERVGIDPQQLTGYQARLARRSLNIMFTDWATRGINYWTTAETNLSLTSGTSTYTLPAGTVDILSAVVRRSGTDTTMTRMALTDYNALPVKTTQGLPTQFFFDRQYTPQIKLWQVPENSTDTIVYWALMQIEDITGSNQDADIPYRWIDAMCAGLALRIYTKLPTLDAIRLAELKQQATDSFNHAATDENERATLKIVPTSALL